MRDYDGDTDIFSLRRLFGDCRRRNRDYELPLLKAG